MQRPDKIKIGYREYKLEEWKQTVASANEAQGQFFAKEGVIGYTAEETGVSHANTLIHELLHFIDFNLNVYKAMIFSYFSLSNLNLVK